MEEIFDILTELGEFTGKTATRTECHAKGLWHRAVYAFIINRQGDVLLQKRSANKKLWPNRWDVTVGGHVIAGEFGRQALIRECREELGIDVIDNEIKFIVATTSVYQNKNYINNHYDECYIILKDIDVSTLQLQLEEVSEAKYISANELINRIDNNYQGLTEKTVSWSILKQILKSGILNQLIK